MPAAADLVVLGDTWTGDATRSRSGGVAVRGDRIVATGQKEQLREYVGRTTRAVDATGKLVVPGFQDEHVHDPFTGRDRRRVWLPDLAGKDAYLDAVAR